MQIFATITYNSSLQLLNNYTLLRAMSEASTGIDYMKVYCIGYYSGGSKVGSQTCTSPTGWQVLVYSAMVELPSISGVLPSLAIASGNSTHTYKNAGYNDVTRSLSVSK